MNLPKEVFIRFDPNSEKDENFLMASADATDLAEQDDDVSAGKYKLVANIEIRNETKVIQ